MAENRTPRVAETREKNTRPAFWQKPELLPEPDKQPGFAYRWIRSSSMGKADPRNLSAKFREGWEPVSASEQPQLQMLVDPDSRFKDGIEIDGLLLCKTPIEFVEQRNNYYKDQTNHQMEAVDNNLMRQSDARMPLFKDSKSSTSFGKGT